MQEIFIAVAVLSILVVIIVAFWYTPKQRHNVERIFIGKTHVESGMIDEEHLHLQCTEEEFYAYLNRWMEANNLTMATFYPKYMYEHGIEYHPVMIRRHSYE